MAPVWKARDWATMALGRAFIPTTIGRKAWLAGARKARAAPNTQATVSRPHSGGEPWMAMRPRYRLACSIGWSRRAIS